MRGPKGFRVTLVPAGAITHLMCIACGNFRTELAVIVSEGEAPQVGMHHRCVREVRRKKQLAKRSRTTTTKPSPPPDDCDGTGFTPTGPDDD